MKFQQTLAGRRVLVTGHTGFKGSWLSLWLRTLEADVQGISLAPETQPNMFDLCGLEGMVEHRVQDIRNRHALKGVIRDFDPEYVFHMAAQPLVRRSYETPLETFETNTMGTAYLLDALRGCSMLKGVIAITTDKVYENKERQAPYGEEDHLGGKDPYSASKSAAEMVIGGYRGLLQAPLAAARGGNVIGGGDWSEDRLIPDLVRALGKGEALTLRNPEATRPWQHVLCLCHGYLRLAVEMERNPEHAAQAWNFGPSEADTVSVAKVLERFGDQWTLPRIDVKPEGAKPESQILKLTSAKAEDRLGWRPAWALDKAVEATAEWYRKAQEGADMHKVSVEQIKAYIRDMEAG